MHDERVTVPQIRARKLNGPKIAMVTAYDATMASLFDEGGADVLLVGDSLGMVVQGRTNTLGVTLEEMCYHSRAVARGARRALVVTDLPFLSYQVNREEAVRAAGRLLKEGDAEAVKLEGAEPHLEAIHQMVSIGIPVMGHLGLTPQSVHAMGGFRVQGREEDSAQRILKEAKMLEEAGVFSIVLEGIPLDVAKMITAAVSVPTIGIGAGPHCDGQVLVCYDFLGLYRKSQPRFVKRFAELGYDAIRATELYVREVQSGVFPGEEHSFVGHRAPSSDVATRRSTPEEKK